MSKEVRLRNYAQWAENKQSLHQYIHPQQNPVKLQYDLATLSSQIEEQTSARDPEWDLTRDIQPQLDLLERQTEKAIVDLMAGKVHQ